MVFRLAVLRLLCFVAVIEWLGLSPAAGQLYPPASPGLTAETPGIVQPPSPTPSPTSNRRRSVPSGEASPHFKRSMASPAPNSDALGPYLSQLRTILNGSTKPLLVHLCFVGQKEITNVQLAQGASIVEALALWANYRPILVSAGPGIEADQFNVLVGTVNDCRNYLSPQEAEQATHSLLSIRRLSRAEDGYLLLVLGRALEEIDDAVLSLGLVRVQFPDSAFAQIDQVILPPAPPFFRQEPLRPDFEATFEELKADGVLFAPLAGGGISCQLFFPGYVRIDKGAEATLRVHFSGHTRTFRSSSSVVAKLNGQELGQPQIGTSSSEGSQAEFKFSVEHFQPGMNLLTIGGPEAQSRVQTNQDLRVYSDSSLELPKLPSDPKLPDLRLETRTFYPFIGQPDGSNLAVVLADHDMATIEAAWTLLARLAQSANTFFYAAQFTWGDYDPRRHALIVGGYSHLPPYAQKLVALEAFEEAHVNTPLADLEEAASGTNLKQLIAYFLHPNDQAKARSQAEQTPNSPVQQGVARYELGVMVSSPPALPGLGWKLVVTGFGKDAPLPQVKRVVQPAFWNQIRGDIVRWGDLPATLQAHVPGEKNPNDVNLMVEFPFGERLDYRLWLGLVAVLVILFVMFTGWMLGKMDQDLTLRTK
jgi:cellulose synthase operon protein B